MIHGSLFSGIGGFDHAFDLVGVPTAWQVECDKYARAVPVARWIAERIVAVEEGRNS